MTLSSTQISHMPVYFTINSDEGIPIAAKFERISYQVPEQSEYLALIDDIARVTRAPTIRHPVFECF